MARDFYHNNVRLALENDGWFITHDPYPVKVDDVGYEIDFAAEAIIAAEKEEAKIAIESDRRCGQEFYWTFYYQ
jgi:hypothetical protein